MKACVIVALLIATPTTIAAAARWQKPAASGSSDAAAEAIDEVQIGPLYDQPFTCSEHPEDQLASLGDALGTDCMITGSITPAGGFSGMYRDNGSRNEDWYGWHAKVHAPFDGTVKLVHINPVVNAPGTMGTPPASMIIFERADGTVVAYAHVEGVAMKAGDRVTEGQVVAVVRNNGMARNPHVHVGAVRNHEPLPDPVGSPCQGRLPELVGG